MKMKKLTALTLAGVLCLGMSTTAFAAKSPITIEAEAEKDKDNVSANPDGPIGNYSRWEVGKGETADDASARIKTDIQTQLTIKRGQSETTKDLNEKRVLDKEIAELEKLDLNKKFELVSADDIIYTGADKDERDFKKDPVKVKFNLNGKGVKAGDKVNIMHKVKDEITGIEYWTVMPNVEVLKYDDPDDPSKSMYYVDYKFESFSDVVILKSDSTGSGTVVPPQDDPKDDPKDDPTVNPGTNGYISADQLADLIVKKLQQNANATNIVRTSVKASPKTGE